LQASQLQKFNQIADAINTEIGSNFKVYAFSNYVYHENMTDFTDIWSKLPQNSSDNYLFIGMQHNDKGLVGFNLKLRLARIDGLNCISDVKKALLESKLRALGNSKLKSFSNYYAVQEEVMSELLKSLKELKQCCGQRSTACQDCPDIASIKQTMLDLGFRAIPIKFVSDQEPTSRNENGNERSVAIFGEQNIRIKISNDELMVLTYLQDALTQFYPQLGSLSNFGVITKNSNMCESSNKYTLALNAYNSSNAQVKIWLHVWDDPNSDNDLLFEKVDFDRLEIENLIKQKDNFIPIDYPGVTVLSIKEVPSNTNMVSLMRTATLVSKTRFRENHEYDPANNIIPQDLQSRTNGNTELLKKARPYHVWLLDSTNAVLLKKFRYLITNIWLTNPTLSKVGDEFHKKWMSGEGDTYYNEELSRYISTNEHMRQTVKDWGDLFQRRLKLVEGKVDDIIMNDIKEEQNIFSLKNYISERYRLILSEKTTGLGILVNDTEQLQVFRLNDFYYNTENNEWSGSFYFLTHDNFGLDDDDLREWQVGYFGEGFASWWILQHVRGFKPFRTEIRHIVKLRGKIFY
jgi:hypothetical protein